MLGATFTLSLSTICQGKLREVYRWHLPVMVGGKLAGILVHESVHANLSHAARRMLPLPLMRPSGPELAELGLLIEGGRREPVVDRVFPFDKIRKAFAYLEGGRAKGKVVVRFREDE